MIAEIIPEAYDATGKQVSQPFIQRKRPHPTLPMGRYVSQPLAIHCQSLQEIRAFLRGCRAVSDQEQFGKREYWLPPEEFEKSKAGDCEDFSLWTWRQLTAMGLDARIVFGRHGRYGAGHAWTMFYGDGKCFLLEPQARFLDTNLPRLSTLRYHPRYSVSWDGRTLKYYAHKENTEFRPPWSLVLPLLPEWIAVWGWTWLKLLPRLPYTVPRMIWRKARRKPGVAKSLRTGS